MLALFLKSKLIIPLTLLMIIIFITYGASYTYLKFKSANLHLDYLPFINLSSRDYRIRGEELFLQKHDTESAQKYLLKSLELKRDNQNALFLLGRIAFVQNDLYLAISYFDQVIQLDPLDSASYYGLGLTYGYLNQHEQAESSFLSFFETIKILKKIDPDYKESYGLWAAYNDLAWVYFLEGRYDDAERVTDEALEKYSNPWLYTMKGSILLNKGSNDLAKIYFEKASVYADNLTVRQFGEAYTGDAEYLHEKGFSNMKSMIKSNIEKSLYFK